MPKSEGEIVPETESWIPLPLRFLWFVGFVALTVYMWIRLWWPPNDWNYWAVVVGSALLCIWFAMPLVREFRSQRRPSNGTGN